MVPQVSLKRSAMQSTSIVPSSDPNHVLSEAKFEGGDVAIPKGKAAVAHTTRVTVSQTTVAVLSEDELRLAQLGCEYCHPPPLLR